jgi:hypothetical protein
MNAPRGSLTMAGLHESGPEGVGCPWPPRAVRPPASDQPRTLVYGVRGQAAAAGKWPGRARCTTADHACLVCAGLGVYTFYLTTTD